MFAAQIPNKLTRSEENMKDLLTSNVFGIWRYLPPELGLLKFLRTAERLDGTGFAVPEEVIHVGNDTLVTINFDHKGELVQEIFDYLRWISWENRGPFRNVTVHLGETFASKLAHVMNPSLFVMWDDGIARRFWEHEMIESLWNYAGFLKLMQGEARSVISDFQASAGSEDPALFLSGKFGYSVPRRYRSSWTNITGFAVKETWT